MPANKFDDIRTDILRHLDEVMRNANNHNTGRETEVMIQRTLRVLGYNPGEISQELTYLVERGYIKKETEKSGSTLGSRPIFTTFYFYISSEGRDFLHGDSQHFSPKRTFGGINITNIQGAVAIGESSIAIVHKPHLSLYQALDDLKTAVLDSDKISDSEKAEYVSDIETIKQQVAKRKPNKQIISIAWKSVLALPTIEGMLQFVERVKPLIENFIK